MHLQGHVDCLWVGPDCPGADILYRNNGDGRFPTSARRRGMGAAVEAVGWVLPLQTSAKTDGPITCMGHDAAPATLCRLGLGTANRVDLLAIHERRRRVNRLKNFEVYRL